MKKEKVSNNNFCVYKHSAPNEKVYIGITGREPIERWRNGNGYVDQPKFYKAILKYGWENIKHEIIYSSLTMEEACEKEKELIKKYDSVKNGYNCSTGGEYIHEGAYKYKDGDIVGGFKINGHSGRKIVLKCLDCGAAFERYAGCVQRGGIKCKCKTKYNPNPKKREFLIITHKGKTQSIQKWSKELEIPIGTIRDRYKRGQPIDESRQFPKEIKNCKTCGAEFMPKYHSQEYCCNKCQIATLKKIRPMATCQFCEKEFQTARPINSNYRAMFCSIECRVKYQKAHAKYG